MGREALVHDAMWLLGGWNPADGTMWTAVPDAPWKERHPASGFAFKDALWTVAGNNMERDVWRLDRPR